MSNDLSFDSKTVLYNTDFERKKKKAVTVNQSKFVRWYFELSQPQRITLGLGKPEGFLLYLRVT